MSRVRCLRCALFLAVVVVTCAVGLRPDPVEISTTVPPTAADLVPPAAAADVAEPAPPASAVVNPVAGEAVDGDVLDVALRDAGVELSPGSSVYAVRLEDGPEGLTYEAFEAGEGATYDGFWPASSVKLLAASGRSSTWPTSGSPARPGSPRRAGRSRWPTSTPRPSPRARTRRMTSWSASRGSTG